MSARKIFTPEQKVAILREHLIENVPVSQVCDKHGVSIVNFYNWQKVFFENGAAAFERKPNSANVKRQEEVDIEIIIQAGREKYPGVTPRIISDNGPPFVAKVFKHFIRPHSAIGYVTPLAMLEGRQQAIFDERDRKLEQARELRAKTRAAKSSAKSKDSLSNQEPAAYLIPVVAEDRALPGCLPSAAAMPLTEAWAGQM